MKNSRVECISAWNDTKQPNKISNFDGIFKGYTMETYPTYEGDLPRFDEEVCDFKEFDIYYEKILVNDLTINDIKVLERKIKLGKI